MSCCCMKEKQTEVRTWAYQQPMLPYGRPGWMVVDFRFPHVVGRGVTLEDAKVNLAVLLTPALRAEDV